MPAKLPFIKFFPADWIQDTRILSLEARGAWIDLLCLMWIAPTRGKLDWTTQEFERFLGPAWEKILDELQGVALQERYSNGRVTVMSRRILRDAERLNLQRNQTRERVSRFRKRKGNAEVTQQKSEVRSQKSELREDLNTLSSEPEKNSGSEVTPFPPEFLWIEELVKAQNGGFPKERFMDFAWWDAVSYQCGGLSPEFLERELAGIKRWIMDNPARRPTPKGYRRFVASWLERAHSKERRFKDAGAKR